MPGDFGKNCHFSLQSYPADGTKSAADLARVLRRGQIKLASPGTTDGSTSIQCIIFSVAQYDDVLIQRIRECHRRGIVIVVSRPGFTLDDPQGIALLNAGAADVINWCDGDRLLNLIKGRVAAYKDINRVLNSPRIRKAAVGQSSIWIETLKKIIDVARYYPGPVLITGETGTGKELAAKMIHDLDPRPDKGEYTILDCASVVPELSGSEFFGHEKGAFTGAVANRHGVFFEADRGTLFLDEIGELPPALQAQLLRILEEGTYKRVGSNTWFSADFRLVCATNRNLIKAVRDGRFRQDLYYRLADCTICLPPLRDRTEDILLLARHFLMQIEGGSTCEFDIMVRDYLLKRDYPGNVRELKSLVEQMARFREYGGMITLGCIPAEERPRTTEPTTQYIYEKLESALQIALARDMNLDQMLELTTEIAARLKVNDEKSKADGQNISRARILNRAGEALGRTKRTMEDYDKKYNLLQPGA